MKYIENHMQTYEGTKRGEGEGEGGYYEISKPPSPLPLLRLLFIFSK